MRWGKPPDQSDRRDHRIPDALIIDLLVEGQVIVELKAVQELHPIHSAQVMTYLRLSGCPAALLINFNAPTVKQGLTRFDHPEIFRRSPRPVSPVEPGW